MFKKINKMFERLDTIEEKLSDIRSMTHSIDGRVTDCFGTIENVESRVKKLEEIDNLTAKINELIAENVKLKEENAVYLKYYDINSEATDEIKKEVFKEFEIRKLQKVNEALETQLQYSRYTAAAAGMTALCAYNSYRPWGY